MRRCRNYQYQLECVIIVLFSNVFISFVKSIQSCILWWKHLNSIYSLYICVPAFVDETCHNIISGVFVLYLCFWNPRQVFDSWLTVNINLYLDLCNWYCCLNMKCRHKQASHSWRPGSCSCLFGKLRWKEDLNM